MVAMRLARLHRHRAPLSSPAPLLLPVRPIRAPNMGIGTSSDRAAASLGSFLRSIPCPRRDAILGPMPD
jgi:hypothetical protein